MLLPDGADTLRMSSSNKWPVSVPTATDSLLLGCQATQVGSAGSDVFPGTITSFFVCTWCSWNLIWSSLSLKYFTVKNYGYNFNTNEYLMHLLPIALMFSKAMSIQKVLFVINVHITRQPARWQINYFTWKLSHYEISNL